MGIDYNSIAGYGIKINGNLSELGDMLLEDCDGEIENFLENINGSITYSSFGNHLSGDVNYAILVDDPLNKDGRLEKLKVILEDNKLLFKSIELVWINEICIW